MVNVIVFGATGVIGTPIINELAKQQGQLGRIAIFTSPNTVSNKPDVIHSLNDRGVEIFAGELTDQAYLHSVLEGKEDPIGTTASNKVNEPFDTIVSAVGRNAIETQIPLLQLAEATPTVKRFFPSEYGTDVEYNESSASEPTHQLKLKVRAFIRSSIKRLEYTYLVTGPYSDLFLGTPLFGGFDVPAKRATLLYDGEGPISFTSMSDTAKLLVAALKRPEVAKNRALKVNSFTATPNQILAEFEKQTGGQKWTVGYTPRSELVSSEKKAYEEQTPAATFHTLRRIWADGGTLYDKRDNEDLGLTETDTMADAVRKAIEKQAAPKL